MLDGESMTVFLVLMLRLIAPALIGMMRYF